MGLMLAWGQVDVSAERLKGVQFDWVKFGKLEDPINSSKFLDSWILEFWVLRHGFPVVVARLGVLDGLRLGESFQLGVLPLPPFLCSS